MADLTVSNVALAFSEGNETYDILPAEKFTLGETAYINANGKATKSSAAAPATAKFRGMAVAKQGGGLTYLKKGSVTGFDLSGLAYDAPVYLSDTPGKLADAPGTVSVLVGRVMPLSDFRVTKVLYIIGDAG
ncbi:MAG: hypothetical protein ACOYY3_02045 [Chloroflexota bacterium]